MALGSEDIKLLMREVLDERSRVSEAEHREHHDWVRERISKERERAEFWRELRAKSLPGLAWTLLAGAATGLWHLLKTHISWN